MNSKYFKLYASCVVVNGYSESLIYDLERNESYLLPNGFLKPLNNLQKTKFRKFIKEN